MTFKYRKSAAFGGCRAFFWSKRGLKKSPPFGECGDLPPMSGVAGLGAFAERQRGTERRGLLLIFFEVF